MEAHTPAPAVHATVVIPESVSEPGSGELGLDDVGLIAAYREGNLAAYGELARRHQIPLFRLLLGLLGDEDLAEQGCEEVFVLGNQRLDALEDPADFYHWLLGIAREVSQEIMSKQEALNHTLSIHTRAPRDHLKREVHAVLQALEPDHRLALVLVELRNAEHEEVAAALGCALDEVPGIVEGARQAFVVALGERGSQTVADQSIGLDANAEVRHLCDGDVVAGRYRVKSLLGAGGMGAVYCAEKLDDGSEVALKTMLPGHAASETALRRFEREAEAISRLDHENFVKIFDHGQTPEAMRYLVMEYLRGQPLGDLVHEQQMLAPTRALELIAQILRGLDHAHEAGVVHRDLKPDNIMIVEAEPGEEQSKILDLGLAKLLEEESESIDDGVDRTRLTRQGMVFGTPAYMAPEQALGAEVDGRADLYAVTVMLFEMLTGKLPFSATNPSALLVQHVSAPPPSLGSIAGHLDGHPALQTLVDAGLAKQPEARIPSAGAYLEQLSRVLAGPLPAVDKNAPPASARTLALTAASTELLAAKLPSAGQDSTTTSDVPATPRSETGRAGRAGLYIAVLVLLVASLGVWLYLKS